MNIFDRAASSVVIPFTPSTYDNAFPLTGTAFDTAMTPDVAMTIPAVYACTTVICETTATVPLQIFESKGDEGKELARDHELYEPLHDQPNPYQTAAEFREMMTAFALNRGKGIAKRIKVTRRGSTSLQLKPLHPDLVSTEWTDTGVLRYRYQNPVTRKVEVLLSDEVFVVRGRFGRSVLSYASESLRLQKAMQDYATQSYRRGPRHTGVILRPKDAPRWNDKNREIFREALEEYQGGGDREGRPLLLEDGMTWSNSSFTMADAEFLGSLQHGVADVCRWYRVPQHKIQELLRSTNNNIERQSIDYVTDSILPWAVRWEQSIRRDLIVDTRFFAEHNLEGLLRADTKARYESYAIAVQMGWLTRNEVRVKENMNPLPGLDEPLTALNMGTTPGSVNVPGTGVAYLPDASHDAAVVARLRLFSRDAASRLHRKEVAALTKLAERTGGEGDAWRSGVEAFYREHAEFVARVLRLTPEAAESYCDDRRWRVQSMGPGAIDDPEESPVADLVELAVNQSLVLQLPAGAAA